ncbi:putative 8-amino-7-oxononanoate synthase [Paenibacillus marchantiophytorum]|uniref:8-amino-7-ketopelargonate synthase n=1 Tax=Paenibacillus marchantiophytorum TaxID=1619310 RepID=A0ABQ1EPX0_9BACL|nr:8-amino-7-oxononanoate synthase [Paenibacillus marchantiophytorum]GFZ81918.1 putative 8-amino-7-oxononanoate synthase [Paenibacillus marchantiophytorum]
MNWMEDELEAMDRASILRSMRASSPVPERPGYTIRGNRPLLNLSSNDYLGLSQHPAIIAVMQEALLTEGCGSGASRLVTGNRAVYERLEEALSEWQNSEAALVFANGYMANTGVISAIAGRGDVVFSDQLNHASIVDGIQMSRAEHARYRHNDMAHLRKLLSKFRDRRRKLIVTDAVFSMDGDLAPLQELVLLKEEYGAILMVDEAHSGGIYGEKGKGLCHALGLQDEVDIHVGTFSKAFGLYGAYVCGNRTLIRWLTNKARPLIYSTALPPSLVAGISKALDMLQSENWRREQLHEANKLFRASLHAAGFAVGGSSSPIVPIIVGENDKAVRFSAALEEKGIAAVAIRPPTVLEGTARIRFSLTAAHTKKELIDAAVCIRNVGIRLGDLRQ